MPRKPAYQDGATFYDATTGKPIATYRDLVAHDYDMQGAISARAAFLTDFPAYYIEP
jgi:hypothetical protein